MTDKQSVITPAEFKRIVKEGLREWLDEKFAEFGRWTFRGVIAVLVAVLLWLALLKAGWTPPKG